MRDASRIDVVCDELKKIWKRVPDWRLMQLFCNLQKACGSDLFYAEDDRLIELLDRYLLRVMGKEET